MDNNETPERWAVIETYGHSFDYAQIYSETAKTVEAKVGLGRRLRRVSRSKIIGWYADGDSARRIIDRLVSARSEMDRRTREARHWFEAEKAKITASAKEQGK